MWHRGEGGVKRRKEEREIDMMGNVDCEEERRGEEEEEWWKHRGKINTACLLRVNS